jgi:hypothetical protein
LFINQPRLYPSYAAVNYLTNGAGHQYNGFTAEVKRRTTSGLNYQLSYTLARDIGDLERDQSPENAYDRQRERGPWIDIPKNLITGNVIWEIPAGKGKRFASNASGVVNALVGGWSTSLIYTFHSGRYLTPLWTGPDPTGTTYTTSSAPANLTIRPDCLFNPNLPNPSIYGWFNAAALTAPAPGRFGTCGSGIVIGPALSVMQAGIFKAFTVKERLRIRAEATATNVLNHANYNDPTLNISQAGNVGIISGVGGASNVSGASTPLDPAGPRAFRTGLRLEF